MMELKVASRSQIDEGNTQRCFHYYLVIDSVESQSFLCENYGVRIQEEGGDCSVIRNITTSAERIDELLSLLVDHVVSPTVLEHIIDDWL